MCQGDNNNDKRTHKLNNFHQPDKIWKPKPIKCLLLKVFELVSLSNALQPPVHEGATVSHDPQHEVVEQKKIAG